DLLLLAANAHGKGFALGAGDGLHTGHLEQIRYVLGVVDLIEEILLVRIHVHARDEEVFRVNGHEFLLFACTAGEPPGLAPRLTADKPAHPPHGNVSVSSLWTYYTPSCGACPAQARRVRRTCSAGWCGVAHTPAGKQCLRVSPWYPGSFYALR